MTIAVDASSPSVVAGSGATLVTAAFTPPDGCVIWAFAQGDANNGSSDEALSFSDNFGGTWSTPVQDNARGGAVVAAAWRSIPATSPGSMTVTLTDNKGSVAKRLFVRVMTGTDLVNPQGATAAVGTASVSIVSTVANSWTWSVYLGGNATITAGANTTLQDEAGGFDSGDAVATFSATTTTATPGTTVTLVESGGTAVHHVAVEIVPPGAATNYAGPWTGPTPGRLGPTGQWTTQPLPFGANYAQALAGSLTPSGTVAKQDAAAKAGTLTPSGALTKQGAIAKAGTLTPAGTLAKQDTKPLAGTLTPAGAAAKQDQKALVGSETPAGALAKQAKKAFAGTETPAGALTTIKVVLRSFAGTLTPAGSLVRAAAKGLAGTLTPAGALAKAASKAAAGALGAAGGLAKQARKAFAATLSASGTLARQLVGANRRATSTSTVTGRRTSTSAVTDRRTSTSDVEG